MTDYTIPGGSAGGMSPTGPPDQTAETDTPAVVEAPTVMGTPGAVVYYCVDGTTQPVAREIEWVLRYGQPTKDDLLAAASIVNAYSSMCSGWRSAKDAVMMLCRARRAHKQYRLELEGRTQSDRLEGK